MEQTNVRASFGGQVAASTQSPYAQHTPAISEMSNRITPLRRSIRTRSMLAAAHNENLAFASSLGVSAESRAPSARDSKREALRYAGSSKVTGRLLASF